MASIGPSDIDHIEERQEKQRRLRELAAWYRTFAERAGDPVIWEARLRTAAELQREADQLEEEFVPRRETAANSRWSQTGKSAGWQPWRSNFGDDK